MTKTHTTATAAHAAQVTPRTIRRWAAAGRVVATKTTHGWAIDADSLSTHIAARIARRADQIIALADFTPFKNRADAHDGVMNLLQDGSVIHLTGGLYQVASKTSNNVYLVDTENQTCDCKAHGRLAYCSHLTAANAIEASKGNVRPARQLAEIIVRVEGRNVARAGTAVRYHGSRTDMHGLYTLTGMCRCDDDQCDEAAGRELIDSAGRTLVHVNRSSFTAA